MICEDVEPVTRAVKANADGFSILHTLGEEHDRQGIQQVRLNRPVQRTRSIDGRIATRSEIVLRLVVDMKSDLAVRETVLHLFQAQVDDTHDVLLRKSTLDIDNVISIDIW